MSDLQQQLLARGQRSNSGTRSAVHLGLPEWEYTDQQLGRGGGSEGGREGGRYRGRGEGASEGGREGVKEGGGRE